MHDGGSVGLDVTSLLITYTEGPGKPRSANETYIKTVWPAWQFCKLPELQV
jgi:hypothetical protein